MDTLTTDPEADYLVDFPDQPMDEDIANYVRRLAARRKDCPLMLHVKVHPLYIAGSLASEIAERGLACPPWESASRRLCDFLAGPIMQFAGNTLAHFVLINIEAGRDLRMPAIVDPLARYAIIDSQSGMFRRFAPGSERIPPEGEAAVGEGMIVIVQPIEPGFYRLPDGDAERTGLGQEDSALYCWTLRALLILHELFSREHPGPDGQEIMKELSEKMRALMRLIWSSRGLGEASFAQLSACGMLFPPGFDFGEPALRGLSGQPVFPTLEKAWKQTAAIKTLSPGLRAETGRLLRELEKFMSAGCAAATSHNPDLEHKEHDAARSALAREQHAPPHEPHLLHHLEPGIEPEPEA